MQKACAATYLYKSSGTCVNIRVARSSHSVDAICANIHAALCQAVPHIPKAWANIQVRHDWGLPCAALRCVVPAIQSVLPCPPAPGRVGLPCSPVTLQLLALECGPLCVTLRWA